MGNIINEQNLITATIDMNESIIQTQYARFLQESPTFVTYYKLSNIESTTDQGFLNVERTVGPDSPVRYNKVNDLPIYGLEQIVLSLDEDEEGLDMNYEGSAIILPNTITPNPSDHFYINYLKRGYIFQVINMSLDTVRSNPYYRIDFKLRAIDDGSTADQLDKQSTDEFNCIHTNIGTEDKVLVRSADIEKISKLEEIKKAIEKYYIMAFYDARYNSFLFNAADGLRYYDRALTNFIIETSLFNKKGTYKTIQLTNEAKAPISELEYHNSIYRALIKNDPGLLKPTKYHLMFVGDFESVFSKWQDGKIRVIEQGTKAGNNYYIRPDLLDLMKNASTIFAPVQEVQEDEESEIKIKEIILPDINNKPVYVPEANITKKFTPETTIEEAAKIPRSGDCCNKERSLVDEDGSLDLDALFSTDYEPSEPNVVVPVLDEPEEVVEEEEEVIDVIPLPAVPIEEEELEPEEKIVVVSKQDYSIPGSKYVIEMNVPEYLTDTAVSQNNIMELTLAKYFGGHLKSVSDLELEGLEDYLDFMDINSLETFILTPMLLFVLGNYTKQT